MTNELKEMYDASVLEINDLYQQLAARDQLITAVIAEVGPIKLPLELLDKVNDKFYTGYGVSNNAEDQSITLTVHRGESDEPEQGSEESK